MNVDKSDVEMNSSAKSKSDVNTKGSDDDSSVESGSDSDGNKADGSDGESDLDSDESVQPAPSSSPPRKKPARRPIKSEADLAHEITVLRSQHAKGRACDIKPKPTRPSVKPSATKKRAVKVEEYEADDDGGDEPEDESEWEVMNRYKKIIILNHTRKVFLATCSVRQVQDAENFEPQYDDNGGPVYWKNGILHPHLELSFDENGKVWKDDLLDSVMDPSGMQEDEVEILETVSCETFWSALSRPSAKPYSAGGAWTAVEIA
ncbi:hypothetical protein FRC12_012745 [Ceratobasidium sp. 428]|nr:hypothetical protein FRC12_012745 [Ceratobasidium sp. 428]